MGTTTRRRGRLCAAVLALAAMLAGARPASALDAAIATECVTCQFPVVVSVAAQCTGVYMGGNVILTAAHCTDDVREGKSRAFFGEDIGEPSFAAVIERCVRHPDGDFTRNALGEDSYEGVDLAFCTLDDAQPIPDVPLVPAMVPTGCERDWLAQQVEGGTATLTAVGFGCAERDDGSGKPCDAGVKRHVGVQLVRQLEYAGSATKLELQRAGANETALMAGDSGGPYFARLPDGTWRLVALHHGANAGVSGAFVESVAPYVHWVESASRVDVTPCLDFAHGAWTASADCTHGVPIGASELGGEWEHACRSPVAAGGIAMSAACAATGSDAPGDGVLFASSTELEQAARRVLAVAPERREARLEAIVAEMEPRAVFPFLDDELPEMAPLASLRDAVRADHEGEGEARDESGDGEDVDDAEHADP